MILGVVIRNFKTYKGINYIPISKGTNFCGIIGVNGIGKSSILEAFDCVFNDKEWNKNIDALKAEESYVMPVLILEKDFFKGTDIENFTDCLSDSIKDYLGKEIPTVINQQRRAILETIQKQGFDWSEKMIISFAYTDSKEVNLGVMADIIDRLLPIEITDQDTNETKGEKEKKREIEIKQSLYKVYMAVREKITYIYIPKDIEPERFVKFETEEIQHLLGENLIDIIKSQLPEGEILEISKNLKSYIEDLSNTLPNYQFKTNSTNQPNLKAKEIYNLIVHDFFSKRELFKNAEGKDIPLSNLSSGEKQQAIMTLIHSCVTKYRNDNNNLIIGVDEPESALHISLCYDQFHKLFEISQKCNQVIFSSHWYGFIPSIEYGNVVNIVKKDGKHSSYIYDVYQYREQIKNDVREHRNSLPIDVSLKGINDLIQSIITSVICDNYYNWLICEGSSDKIYLSEYLKNEIQNHRLRIVPVCGVGEVKKIYQNLALAFEDLRTELKGKVFLLIDTDSQFHDFESKPTNHLLLKRLVNDGTKKETILVDNQSNPKSPKTDIEDVLNGKAFNRALNCFKEEFAEFLSFVDNEEKEEIPSFYAMDLKPSIYDKLDEFFSSNNNKNKVLFAKKYVQLINEDNYQIPSWIQEIQKFYDI